MLKPLAIINIILAGLFFFLVRQALYNGLFLLWPILIFIIYAASWGLLALLLDSKRLFLLISFISLLFSLFILPLANAYLILPALLFFYIAYNRTQGEKKILVQFKINKILSRGFIWFLVGIALLVSVGYFHSPGLELAALEQDAMNLIDLVPSQNVQLIKPLLQEKISEFFAGNSLAGLIPYGMAGSLFLSVLALNFVFLQLTIGLVSIIIFLLKKAEIIKQEEETCQRIIIKF